MKEILQKIAEAASFLKEEKIEQAVAKLSEATELATDTEDTQPTEEDAEKSKLEMEEVAKTVSMNFYNDTMKEMLDDMREAIESLKSDVAQIEVVKTENAQLKEEINKIASVRGQSQQIQVTEGRTSPTGMWDAI